MINMTYEDQLKSIQKKVKNCTNDFEEQMYTIEWEEIKEKMYENKS